MKKLITMLLTITMVMRIILPVAQADNSQIAVTINNQEIKFDQPPVIIDGRTLVPVHAVSEAFDCKVNWDDNTKIRVSLNCAYNADAQAAMRYAAGRIREEA